MKSAFSTVQSLPTILSKHFGFSTKSAFLLVFFSFSISSGVNSQGLTIFGPTPLTTTEGGSPVSYTVELTLAPNPGEMVTITPTSNDPTEGTVSGPLIFNNSNWNIPQQVLIMPLGDGINDGDLNYAINNILVSSGGIYTGVLGTQVDVNNFNIDGFSTIIVDPSSGIEVNEEGTTVKVVTFSTSGTLPTADITISLTNNSPTEVTLSTTTIVLNAGNGYSDIVTITGVLDMVVEGTQAFSVTVGRTTTGDINYDLDPVDISGRVTDKVVAPVAVAIPTVGQWGLIILGLLMLTFSVVALTRPDSELAK